VIAVILAVCGTAGTIAVSAPTAVRAVRRHRILLSLGVLIGLAAAWTVTGLRTASTHAVIFTGGQPFPLAEPLPFQFYLPGPGWPWRIGGAAVLPLVLTVLCASGGLVLIADAVRVQLGLAAAPRAPWVLITTPIDRGGRIAWRAIPGVALVAIAAFLAISLTSTYVAGDALAETLVELAIGGWAAALIASPLAVGIAMQLDLDKAGRAREQERQRFAAHLHDSVLQTLALVQRQAHDPAAVTRLARRQEHALRAWMAGAADLGGDTVTATLRDVTDEVEAEHSIKIELTAIGDHTLDERSEALIGAAREALRNAARHAPGSPVFVFSDITADRAELFIRDQGPGFDPDAVPAERRGLRDAVIGRMAAAGGSATVESTPGQGTEIALQLPYSGRTR
jgi:signal transduction histidine kinase